MNRYITLLFALALLPANGCKRGSESVNEPGQPAAQQPGPARPAAQQPVPAGPAARQPEPAVTSSSASVPGATWEKLHAGSQPGEDAPSGAEGCAIAYDAARHCVFLFGGKGDGDRSTNDLWAFDLEARRWSRVESDGTQPPAREDHSLIVDQANDALVLYGGEQRTTSRHTWTFELQQKRWQDITHDSAPFRHNHVAMYDPKGKRMIVFGGVNEERTLSADVWALNLDRNSPSYGAWSVVTTSDPNPGGRTEHAAAYDSAQHRLLILGGRHKDKKTYLNDVWALDLEAGRWTQLQTRGDAPYPLVHTAVSVNSDTNELVVFGGEVLVRKGDSKKAHVVDAISVLDLNTLAWTDRTAYPPPMYDHSGVFVPEYGGSLIYGGSSHRAQKEHTAWLVSPSAGQDLEKPTDDSATASAATAQVACKRLHAGARPGEDTPGPGEDCALAYDGTRHRVYLYGGKGDDDLNTNELWAFDLESRRWSRIRSDGPQPPPREDHSLVFDPANDLLVLFGGEDGPVSRETWMFDIRTNRWENTTHKSAPFRQDHRAVYDPKGKRMVVFGGGGDENKLGSADTLCLNLDRGSSEFGAWSVLPTSDPKPLPRTQCAVVYDSTRHRLVVFGGRERSKDKKTNLNDAWSLDLEAGQWTELQTSGEIPPPLIQTAATFNPSTNELLLVAGEAAGGERRKNDYMVNSVWVLNLDDLTWTDRSPYPRAVYDHASVFVPEYGGTLVYGGRNARGKEHSTWLLKRSDSPTEDVAVKP